jgi:hypothetical protein
LWCFWNNSLFCLKSTLCSYRAQQPYLTWSKEMDTIKTETKSRVTEFCQCEELSSVLVHSRNHSVLLLYFLKEKNKYAPCVSLPFNFGTNWPIFKKICMSIVPLEGTSTCNNMIHMQTYEVSVTLVPLNVGSWDYIW